MCANHISYPKIRPLGEDSVLVEFEAKVSLEINRKARRLVHGLEQADLPGLKMAIPAYRSVKVLPGLGRQVRCPRHPWIQVGLSPWWNGNGFKKG